MPTLLLQDLKRLLRSLEEDLRDVHADSDGAAGRFRPSGRPRAMPAGPARPCADFRDDALTQAAVHWILGCVFLRFLEDNGLVERRWLAGPGERLHARPRPRTTPTSARTRTTPTASTCSPAFDEAAALPGLPASSTSATTRSSGSALSGDGAMALLDFFQRIDPDTGRAGPRLHRPGLEHAVPRRPLPGPVRGGAQALRAAADAGVRRGVHPRPHARPRDPRVRLPRGAADRPDLRLGPLPARRLRAPVRPVAAPRARHATRASWRRRALDAVAGVDLNPFAVAIARFRLLLAALKASRHHSACADAPGLHASTSRPATACCTAGTSTRTSADQLDDATCEPMSLDHVYHRGRARTSTRILGRQYHAVVGNPPYITPKDAALNEAYRERYASCHMQVLARRAVHRALLRSRARRRRTGSRLAGYVGMITANSLHEARVRQEADRGVLPRCDLTHVIDTSGAYIPGHGTPTVILFGRNRAPVAADGAHSDGHPRRAGTPDDPAHGLVWTAIVAQVDQPGIARASSSASPTRRASASTSTHGASAAVARRS